MSIKGNWSWIINTRLNLLFSLDLPSPVFGGDDGTSVTLTFEEPPPELPGGDPPRSIAVYVVTFTPQDGGPAQTVSVPAEEGATLTVSGLTPETAYDVSVSAGIETEGQGLETFDLGFAPLAYSTCKCYNYFLSTIWRISRNSLQFVLIQHRMKCSMSKHCILKS